VHIFTAVDSAFSNGLNERPNQTLINCIRCQMNERKNKKSWTSIAQECVREYKNTLHSATGFSPSYLMNGVQFKIVPASLETVSDWARDRKEAFENSKKMHERNKTKYDKNIN